MLFSLWVIGQECEWGGRVRLAFFSPPGRRSRQRDEGARVPYIAGVAPSSDPSGHLLPGGEKKLAANAEPKLTQELWVGYIEALIFSATSAGTHFVQMSSWFSRKYSAPSSLVPWFSSIQARISATILLSQLRALM